MSPEQIRGLPLDLRADVYSFGCTLYHLGSGQPPYTGSNADDLLNKHLRAAPPALDAANRNVTPEYAALVRRLMSKNQVERPASMGDVLTELRAIKMFKTPPTKPADVDAPAARG
jgi:eukaryotic-like serine/threonine-protein kinase